jgi:hypothetical protein
MSVPRSSERTLRPTDGPASKGGPNIEYQKDGARYFLRGEAKTVEGWTADYYRPGSKKADIEIRLGDD